MDFASSFATDGISDRKPEKCLSDNLKLALLSLSSPAIFQVRLPIAAYFTGDWICIRLAGSKTDLRYFYKPQACSGPVNYQVPNNLQCFGAISASIAGTDHAMANPIRSSMTKDNRQTVALILVCLVYEQRREDWYYLPGPSQKAGG